MSTATLSVTGQHGVLLVQVPRYVPPDHVPDMVVPDIVAA